MKTCFFKNVEEAEKNLVHIYPYKKEECLFVCHIDDYERLCNDGLVDVPSIKTIDGVMRNELLTAHPDDVLTHFQSYYGCNYTFENKPNEDDEEFDFNYSLNKAIRQRIKKLVVRNGSKCDGENFIVLKFFNNNLTKIVYDKAFDKLFFYLAYKDVPTTLVKEYDEFYYRDIYPIVDMITEELIIKK